MQALAYKAYGNVQQRTAGEKEIEYALFKQITEQLEEVAASDTPAPSIWIDAVSRNLQMWTILATDLAMPENAIQDETKRGLISLSEFVRRSSMQILAGEGDTEVADLIEINNSVMQGLRMANPQLSEVAA